MKKLAFVCMYTLIFLLNVTCIVSIKHIWQHENYTFLIEHRSYLSMKRLNYDTSNKVFQDITLGTMDVSLYDCEEGCNIRIQANDQPVEFLFEKYIENFYLTIVCNTEILYTNMQLGTSLEGAFFRDYNGLISFYLPKSGVNIVSELMLFVNEEKYVDEILSVGEPLKFIEEGILYSTVDCDTEIRTYAIREPFSKEDIISQVKTPVAWCS